VNEHLAAGRDVLVRTWSANCRRSPFTAIHLKAVRAAEAGAQGPGQRRGWTDHGQRTRQGGVHFKTATTYSHSPGRLSRSSQPSSQADVQRRTTTELRSISTRTKTTATSRPLRTRNAQASSRSE
jgi:hypothetical protein